MIEVTGARYLQDYKLWLEFNNGKSGEVDLESHLWGPVFISLKNFEEFKKFKISTELGTIT